jgi:hypothetical protein
MRVPLAPLPAAELSVLRESLATREETWAVVEASVLSPLGRGTH